MDGLNYELAVLIQRVITLLSQLYLSAKSSTWSNAYNQRWSEAFHMRQTYTHINKEVSNSQQLKTFLSKKIWKSNHFQISWQIAL